MTRLCLCALVALTSVPALAQPGLWSDVDGARAPARTDLVAHRTVRLELGDLRALLSPSPSGRRAATFDLPLPEGGFAKALVIEAPVMHPDLQARYPSIRTYTVQGAALSGRVAVTPHGVSAMLFDEVGTVMLDPVGGPNQTDATLYAVYRAGDVVVTDETLAALTDDQLDNPGVPAVTSEPRVGGTSGAVLQTFRFAVATRGEFTVSRGGSRELGLAAVVASVNRVAALFERDLTVTFQLVADNDRIIYTDPSTDPYDTTGPDLLTQNQTAVDRAIGLANYDLGHLLSVTDGGGLAYLRGACASNGTRAGAWSSVGDETSALDLLVFPHEIGHQLGAQHSWVSYAPGKLEPEGVEPGPGYTIMAYPQFASYRPPDERVGSHFHGRSVDQMEAHVRLGVGQCGADAPTGNDVPVVTVADRDVYVPAGASFTLDGSATDASGTALTYTWEQMDQYGDGTGAVPLFRALDPGPETSRTFPSLERTLAGTPYPDEARLDQTGIYTFQLTARDNVAGGGATGEARVRVHADASQGAFELVGTDRNLAYAAGADADVLWDVAGSDGGQINAQTVDVMLSTDNGATWTTVAAGVPNDGVHVVTMPPTPTSEGRLMVRPVGKPFFAVSRRPFTIGAAPSLRVSGDALEVRVDPGDSATAALTVTNAAPDSQLDYDADLENVLLPGGQDADAGGYVVSVSGAPGGPEVGFTDISRTGSRVNLGPVFFGSATVDLPFPFKLYGQTTYTAVQVSVNGILVFGDPGRNDFLANMPIPDIRAPNAFVAPFWDDLSLVHGGRIHTELLADGRFAVQYTRVDRYTPGVQSPTASYTFQALLSADGTVEFQYGELEGLLDRATVGIENHDGTDGEGVAFDSPFLSSHKAVRFTPARRWVRLENAAGELVGGASGEVDVRVDASGYPEGTRLTADLVLHTNDGSRARVVVPVTMTVSSNPVTSESGPDGVGVSLVRPNPTASSASVRMALAAPTRLVATVHDALGREVARLHDGPASGTLDLRVEAGRLAVGVYLVRVAGDGFAETRQFVVVR